jgi:RES domain-containing protein
LRFRVSVTPKQELLKNFFRIPAGFDTINVIPLDPIDLPEDWDSFPPPQSTQNIGSQWVLKKKSMVLKVPSTVVKEEFNYLINPAHPDFHKLSKGKRFKFNYSIIFSI